MASQHETQPLSPIFRLPTDLLFDILSLVVPFVSPLGFQPPCEGRVTPKITESPLHCVRSTCRDFRRIADQLPFWYADDFDISDILKFEPKSSASKMTWGTKISDPVPPYSPYLEVILSDSHLQRCLDRKTHWFVANPRLWEALVHSMPDFGPHIQYLKLKGNGEYYPYNQITPTLFAICPVLTYLEIESANHICPDGLPKTLEILRITGPRTDCDCWHSDCDCCDCENHLPNLEELHHTSLDHGTPTPLDFRRVLPLQSTESCRELRLEFATPWPPSIHSYKDFELLHQFKNLTSLIIPLTSGICRDLLESPLRLKEFRTTVFHHDLVYAGAFVDLLNSPILQLVESLGYTFSLQGYSWQILEPEPLHIENVYVYEPLVRTIAKLPKLEHLDLGYPLLRPWLEHFRSSPALKRISWDFHEFSFVHIDGKYDDAELEEALSKILEEFGGECRVKITGPGS